MILLVNTWVNTWITSLHPYTYLVNVHTIKDILLKDKNKFTGDQIAENDQAQPVKMDPMVHCT